jgi:PAS domain S-box-containing protein
LIRLARDLDVTPEWLRFGESTGEQRLVVGATRPMENRRERASGLPGANVLRQPESPQRPKRVIEHPLLRLNELTEKVSRAEAELQEAIRALSESEERFRRVFEDGPLGMGMADAEYRIIKVNRRYCEMLGYTEEELCRMTLLDITHPDDRALALEVHTRLYQEEPPYLQYEQRFLKKTREIVFGRATIFVVKDREGTPPHSMAITEDITAQRLMEEELKRPVQQQELVLQSVADGIIGSDARGLARFVNPAAVRLLGWEADDVIGQDFHNFAHPRKPDGTPFLKEECPITAAWDRAAVIRGNDQWYRKDGAMLAVEYVRAPIVQRAKSSARS